MFKITTFVLLVSVAEAIDYWKFDFKIIDGKDNFTQNVETNLEKNIVKIYTPAHNDNLESHTMQDFKKGKQITCLPSINECRLRDIQRTNAVDAGKLTESFVHTLNTADNIISTKDLNLITELYFVEHGNVDTDKLGNELEMFYKQFVYPLYLEKMIPNDAKVLDITDSSENRMRRSFRLLGCNGAPPVMKYGVATRGNSNYLTVCNNVGSGGVLKDCSNVHIFSPAVYRCMCCAWVTTIHLHSHDCVCFSMRN